MTVRVELHRLADREVDEIFDWYEDRRPGLGFDFFRELHYARGEISNNPRASALWEGRRGRELGVRRYVMQRFPFVLPFVVREDLLVILAIAHMRRRPGYWIRRAG